MKKLILLVLALCWFGVSAIGNAQDQRLRIASTTSTDNTGLFAALPPLEELFNCHVDVIAQGTRKALRTGEMGDFDVVFAHSRLAEDRFVETGYGVNRRDVMYNGFAILGPKEDPAGIRGLKDATDSLRRIANSKAPFVSRGHDSGTHKKEKAIWEKAGLSPEGRWYMEAGQGMGAVLQIANEKRAYALSDRGTYLAYRGKINLDILTDGDPLLFNHPCGIIAVSLAKHPTVNYLLAMAYIGWASSPEGQKIIREFGKEKFGQALFIPVAIP